MKLTRQQRQEFTHGKYPRLAGEGPCPVEVDAVLPVAKDFTIRVTGIRWLKGGKWVLDYAVSDQRPNLLRRTPPAGQARSDDRGEPLPTTASEIEYARIDGTYTSSPAMAVPGEPEAVPDAEIGRTAIDRAKRDQRQAEIIDGEAEFLAACKELRDAIENLPPAKRKRREVYLLRSKIDRAERQARERAAA